MDKYSKVWTMTAVVAGLTTVWFIWPWLSVIVLSGLMAYLFYPMYKRLYRKKGHVAAVISLIVSFLVVLVPLFIIVIAAVGQLFSFADAAHRYEFWGQTPAFAKNMIHTANEIIEPITGMRPSVSEQGVIDYLRNTAPAIARAAVGILIGVMTSLPAVGIALLLYTLLFMEFLKNGPKIIGAIKKISPLPAKITDRYVEQTGMMANAMVKGQMAIAFIIALFSSLLLLMLGYDRFFFVFLILFTVLNFIPLGCGIVVIPLAIYSMFTGQFWLGLVVLVVYNFIGYLDPILRPRFVPKAVSLSTAWTIVGTFCGIAYFGILGVVYGPVVMLLIISTWKFYIEATHNTPVKSA